MKTLPARGLALLLVFLPLIVQAAAPVNDKFANATILRGRSVTLANQTGAGSTPEALDPFIGGVKLVNTVWYQFDANTFSSRNHIVVAHAAGARVGAFRLEDVDGGAGVLALQGEVSNLAAGTDTLTFTVSPQTRFYICVATAGAFSLSLQVPGPDNDFFADAEPLLGNIGTTTGTNANASDEGDLPSPLPSTRPRNGVWYTWTPTFTGPVSLDTNQSFLSPAGVNTHSTVINVFTGSALNALTLVDSDSDGGLGINSRVAFSAVAGTTYRIWVGSRSDAGKPFTLHYQPESSVGTFSIFTAANTVTEGQGSITVVVRRVNAGSSAASVTITSTGGTATSGADFTPVSQTLNFTAGTSGLNTAFEQTVTIDVLPDSITEGTESFTLGLSAVTPGASVSSSTTTISIRDEPGDVAPGFTTTAMTVRESDGTIFMPVVRSSAVGRGSINVSLNDSNTDTATNDVSLFTSSISFSEGQSVIFLNLSLINDGIAEGPETLTLTLTPGLRGQTIDGSSTLTLTILDDETFRPNAGRLTAILDNGAFGGVVDFSISGTGVITGKLINGKGAFPFTGKLDGTGFLRVPFGPVGAPIRTLDIQQLSNTSNNFFLTLSDHVLGNVASKTASMNHFNALFPCPEAGSYTIIDNGLAPTEQLQASCLKVSPLGTATLTGRVFDGTAFAATGNVGADHAMHAAASLYAGQGKISVSMNLGVVPIVSNLVDLMRPGRANQSVELPAINNSVFATISPYTPPAPGLRVLGVWNPAGTGFADLTGGGFVALTTQPINVSTANKVSLVGAIVPSLKLTITPATGIFTGTVIPTGATTPKPVFGVFNQNSNFGQGFFLNGFVDGRVRLR